MGTETLPRSPSLNDPCLVSILCHFFYFPTQHSHRTTVSFSGDNTLHGLRTKNISHPLIITLVYSSYFPSIIIVPSRSGLKSSITNRSVKTVPPKNLHFTVGFCPQIHVMFVSIIKLECEVSPRRDNLNENGTKQFDNRDKTVVGFIH